jgi:diguanylate cyclase (GGDEF)-like protein/PAS domain S-box-containing protein
VKDQSSPQSGGRNIPPQPVSLAVLFGLRTLADGHDDLLRNGQLRAADRISALRTTIMLVAIFFVDLLCVRHMPVWAIVGWTLAMLVVRIPLVRLQRNSERTGYAGANRHMLLRHAGYCTLLGLVWSIPLLFFSSKADPAEMVALWTLSSCLMTAAAIAFHPTPASAVGYLLPISLASVVMMTRQSDPLLTVVVGTFAMLLFVSSLRQSRQFGEQLGMQDKLAENHEVLSLLLREHDLGRSDWLWQVDAQGCLRDVTPAFAQLLGGTVETIEGQKFLVAVAGPDGETTRLEPAVRDFAIRLSAGEPISDFALPVSLRGERRWWEISATPRRDDKGQFLGFRGVSTDITLRQEANERISALARSDALTGLPNRLSLSEAMTDALDCLERWDRGCGLMMIDLDRFKAVNDRLGHQIGDSLLIQVAERMQQACSANETVGRLGGDEFAIVLRDVPGPDYVERLARAIIESVSRPYVIDGQPIDIGASIGSARAPQDSRSVSGLLRGSDLAMYRAKDAGGGRHIAFEPAMQADIEERRMLEAALREALSRDQLHVVYQPIFAVASGAIVGFEALARWTHPVLGPVPPEQFIPIAEEARLIATIGDWVLRTACAEARSWPEDIRLSVNVSPEQLRDGAFQATVVAALAQSGLAAERLELDVTETVFLRERSGTAQLLDRIGKLGVGLALDDFGTGHSSIGFFARARIGAIKVDRAFVAGAARGQRESRAILGAAVAIAGALGIRVIAEGVESRVEYDCVRAMGVDRAQGFHLGRPIAAGETPGLFGARGSQVA